MMRCMAVLAALILAGCKPAEQNVRINFVAVVDGAPVTCSSDGKTLNDMRFYIHDVTLLTADGGTAPVTLDQIMPWQSHTVALVDLEEGTGACDTGSPETHVVITGRSPPGRYTGIRFTLGVPFTSNHADPSLAKAPLDQTTMHWHWRAGYKFMRAGVVDAGTAKWLHLGSTGCEGHIGAISACTQPNRPTVTVRNFDPTRQAVAVDLGTLFSDLPPDGEQSCQSEPHNTACTPILRHLGLSDMEQDVFHAVDR